MDDLRDYQARALDAVRDRMRAGARRVLLVLPTGGGKTRLAAVACARAAAQGRRVLWLAHRTELLDQAAGALRASGVPTLGLVRPGDPEDQAAAVQVASVWTLDRRLEAWAGWAPDLIVCDEAHHAVSDDPADPEAAGNTWGRLIAAWPGARVLGLTATPWRLDGEPLGRIFDAHVVAAEPHALRDAGHLAPAACWAYRAVPTAGLKTVAGDLHQGQLAARAVALAGSVVDEWAAHAGGVPTLVYAVTVEHAEVLAALFRAAGYAAACVHGGTAAPDRARAFADLRAGRIKALANVGVATEGTDLPEVACVVLARPTLSTCLALQMMGRGLRPAPGKAACRIHDHAGVLRAHGTPYDRRDWSPDREARAPRERVDAATGEGSSGAGGVLVQEGALAERMRVEEATERRDRAAAADRAAAIRRRVLGWPEERRRAWFHELAAKRGRGPAAHIYRSITGGWPPS